MPTFVLELRKAIVVEVVANNVSAAVDKVVRDASEDPDGEWARAEILVSMLEEK